MHDSYLDPLIELVQDDRRILAAWLEGSLGRGNADRYSDIDLHLLLTIDGIADFRASAESWLGSVRPLVLFSLLFNDSMINAMTVDGLRVDIWLHPEAPVVVDPSRARILHDPDERIQTAHRDIVLDTNRLLPQIREFWRCVAMLPTVIGRNELIVSLQGLSIETMILTDILMTGNGVVRDRGVKNLNAYLPADARQEIEQALALDGLTQSSLVSAHLALAHIVRAHGPVIAERYGFEYPSALEHAVLAYIERELDLLGISNR